MCGRYSLIKKAIPKEHRYAAKFAGKEPEPNYNAAPSQFLPVITTANPQAVYFTWGLLPAWAKDANTKKSINARAESLLTNPMFRGLVSRKRCLIPADGFYEWQVKSELDMFGQPIATKAKAKKQPFRIALANDDLFSFAGLWDEWLDKSTGELYKSFTIITTDANALVKPIHDRMPVILTPANEERWLNAQENLEELLAVLQPYEASLMKAFPISNLVNSPANNTADILNSL